jgi:signal transduction histidine kinase
VRLGIKGKQVLGVTSIVGMVVVMLSLVHLTRIARVSLDESRSRAELLANAIYHRARDVVPTAADPYQALRTDPGLRSILESSAAFSRNVTFAAITDTHGIAVAHADPSMEGQPLPPGGDLRALLAQSPFQQLAAIYRGQTLNLELTQPLLLAPSDTEFGSIHIGVSALLIRKDLDESLRPAIATAFAALAIAVIVAMLLAQLLLRPIHVIRSGLTRLGRGEFGVRLDLNQHDEFGELGTFFNAVSEQLSADRSQMAGQVANLESAVEHLEDAVAIVNARGELLFANPAMRALLPDAAPGVALSAVVGADHPVHKLFEQALVSRQSRGPVSVAWGARGAAADGERSGDGADRVEAERLVMTHAINDPKGDLVGIMLVARNLEYLSQVQSTIRYSRKLAALGRLSAGVAHEVKNPLNAMMIHLELLRQQFGAWHAAAPQLVAAAAGAPDVVDAGAGRAAVPPVDEHEALQHVDVIANEIRRLDEVVQGFLKFSRPEDLKLQPVTLAALLDEVVAIVRPEADRSNVQLVIECDGVPDVNADPAMLRQAFLNLALNACQAMPNGGTLRMHCDAARGRRVAVSFSDTGVGIKPEHLKRIFDLYFTTKQRGSGIGLSMVYRTVQMHDGEIEVQSTPGAGTTFRLLLPQA